MPIEQFLYTDCPKGKGFDPYHAGYQIKACSPGIDDQLKQKLANICKHHGETVYRHAPKSALDREITWRTKEGGNPTIKMPDDVLDHFPVIWSYSQLSDHLYTFIRTNYAGWTHDNRPGNFLAHAFIFSPEDLSCVNMNPLLLIKSDIFITDISEDFTQLETLTKFNPTPISKNISVDPLPEVFRDKLSDMLSVLLSDNRKQRPLVICIKDYSQSLLLTELLLKMIIPSERYKITFSTFESNRHWLPQHMEENKSQVKSAHDICFLLSNDNRSFQLYSDDYSSKFSVFNFVANEFSKTLDTTEYASFAANSFIKGDHEKLVKYHAFLLDVKEDSNVDSWDLFIPLLDVILKKNNDNDNDNDTPVFALNKFSQVNLSMAQSQIILHLFLPYIQNFAKNDNAQTLEKMQNSMSDIINALNYDSSSFSKNQYLKQIDGIARKLYAKGNIRSMLAVAKLCGHIGEEKVVQIVIEDLRQAHFKPVIPSHMDDITVLLETLISIANQMVQSRTSDIEYFPSIIVYAMACSENMNHFQHHWQNTYQGLISQYLDIKNKKYDNVTFLNIIRKAVNENDYPQNSFWLILKQFQYKAMENNEIFNDLVKYLKKLDYSGEPDQNANELLKIATAKLKEPASKIYTFAIMAEESKMKYIVFIKEYVKGIKKITKMDKDRIRNKLKKNEKYMILAYDFVESILPWNGSKSDDEFVSWDDLMGSTDFMEQVLLITSDRLITKNSYTYIFPLASRLIEKCGNKFQNATAFQKFCFNAIKVIPLMPIHEKYIDNFFIHKKYLPTETQEKLELLVFLRDIHTNKLQLKYSEFPLTDNVWTNIIPSYPDQYKKGLILQCLNPFIHSGIQDQNQAKEIVNILKHVNIKTPILISYYINSLFNIENQPKIIIQIALVFSSFVFNNDDNKDFWIDITYELIKRFDKRVHKLFKKEFHKVYKEKGKQVCEQCLDQILKIEPEENKNKSAWNKLKIYLKQVTSD